MSTASLAGVPSNRQKCQMLLFNANCLFWTSIASSGRQMLLLYAKCFFCMSNASFECQMLLLNVECFFSMSNACFKIKLFFEPSHTTFCNKVNAYHHRILYWIYNSVPFLIFDPPVGEFLKLWLITQTSVSEGFCETIFFMENMKSSNLWV